MNTLDTLKTRRSIRKFTDQIPSKELVDRVAEAGTWAPSGMNRQPAVILAVTNPDMVALLSQENAKVMGKTDIDPFYGAPVVLCVLAAKSSPTHVYDGSLVMGNMLNAAHELGLGACWIHRCKEEELCCDDICNIIVYANAQEDYTIHHQSAENVHLSDI